MGTRQQPPAIQKKVSFTDASLGNSEDAKFDLSHTIENLRNSYPLTAAQIDALIDEHPSMAGNDKAWVFLHTQIMYSHEFNQANKDPEMYAPQAPPSSLTISPSELDNLRKDICLFVEENGQDICDEIEFGPSSLKRPQGRRK